MKSVLDTFVDFIRRKLIEDFRHVFGEFETVGLFGKETMVNICCPTKSLSLWIIDVT